MPPQRIWIMDGHNMIFAIPGLERLQVSDRREEARAGLADRLQRFAIARGEKVLVVFDGNQMLSNPDAVRSPLFEVVYSRRGEGVADDRIIHEARACSARGLTVTVVTDDVRTLAIELPRGVQRLGVRAFWRKHIDKEDRAGDGDGDKRIEGDFSDFEREMLARDAAAEEREFSVGEPAADPARPGADPARPGARGRESAASGPETGAAPATMRDRILDKRVRGRLRQERRLKRHARPAGRR
jgi:predicted RNA-binding protein with PIN domain